MPRPSFTAVIALSLFAVLSLAGCKTIYTDMYRPKRNHFKPEKDTAKPTEILPESNPLDSTLPPAAPAPQAPGLEPAPADPAAPAAPAAPPAIPGL